MFNDVVSSVEPPLVQLDVEWTKRQSELTAAFNKDRDRMAKLNNILSRVSHAITNSLNFSW